MTCSFFFSSFAGDFKDLRDISVKRNGNIAFVSMFELSRALDLTAMRKNKGVRVICTVHFFHPLRQWIVMLTISFNKIFLIWTARWFSHSRRRLVEVHEETWKVPRIHEQAFLQECTVPLYFFWESPVFLFSSFGLFLSVKIASYQHVLENWNASATCE